MMQIQERQGGFAVLSDKTVFLEHSKKNPLMVFSLVRRQTGKNRVDTVTIPPGRFRPVRDWKIIPTNDGSTCIEFPGFLRMTLKAEDRSVVVSFSLCNPLVQCIRLRIPAKFDETLFGLGDGFTHTGLKGKAVYLIALRSPRHSAMVKSAGLIPGKRYYYRIVESLPARFAGSDGTFLGVEATAALRIDNRPRRTLLLDSAGIPGSITIGKARTPLAASMAINLASHPAPSIPAWTHEGIWLDLSGGEERVSRSIHAVLDTGTRVSSIVIKDWAGSKHAKSGSRPAWGWDIDAQRYASLADDVARYRKADIRTLGYLTPYLDTGSPAYERSQKNGWLVKDPDGSPYLFTTRYGKAGFVDLWNTEAYAALKDSIGQGMLGLGMSGWFADYGFFLPPKDNAVHGLPPIRACREYAGLWSRLNAEARDESPRSADIVYIMRPFDTRRSAPLLCAHTRSARWTSEGLMGELAARMSEPGIFYAETGGCGTRARPGATATAEERELSMRWVETAIFSPVFCNGSSAPIMPWEDPALLSHFSRMATVHTMLRDYHMHTLEAYLAEGIPPLAHPSLHFRQHPETLGLPWQFMYGKDLLVTPALRYGETFARCTLPDDEWVHLWTSAEFGGGSVSIEDPPGFPAVFYRASSAWAGLFDRIRVEIKRYS